MTDLAYNEYRDATTTHGGKFRLWVCALAHRNEPADIFHVDANFNAGRASLEFDRDSAIVLRDLLNEALAAGPQPDGGTWTEPMYQPRYEVVDNVEAITNRLACCGSGPDQRDERTGERLHLPGCNAVLIGVDEDPAVITDQRADAGAYDEAVS